MSERADVTFESRGVTCAGYLYLPDPTAGEVPCVVMAHGFSGTRNLGLTAYAARFTAAGMAVLVFDYAYFGASGGQPRQLLNLGHQLDDYRAAIAFARARPRIDPARIGRASERSAKVTLQLLAAAAFDTVRGWQHRAPHLVPVFGAPGDMAAFTNPHDKAIIDEMVARAPEWRNAVAARMLFPLMRYQPRTAASRLAMPLLVCIAEKETAASPALTADMASRAPKAELRRYPIGHFDAYAGQWLEKLATDQIAFLRAHLAIKTAVTPAQGQGQPAGQ